MTAEREREQKVEDGRYYRFERRFGTFTRTIGLPQGVTEQSVSAEYRNGVLEVHVAKPEQPKPRKIEIAVGGARQREDDRGRVGAGLTTSSDSTAGGYGRPLSMRRRAPRGRARRRPRARASRP